MNLKKIWRNFPGTCLSLITLVAVNPDGMQVLYGPGPVIQPLYGVATPTPIEIIGTVLLKAVLPLVIAAAIIVGIVVSIRRKRAQSQNSAQKTDDQKNP